jgi:predicted acylesterase/phospholipase RssA
MATLAGAIAGGCTETKTRGINSDRLLTEFNGGAVDSFPDPALCVDDIAMERVALTAKRSLVRGFVSQGKTTGPNVAAWMRAPEVRALVRQLVLARRRQPHDAPRIALPCAHCPLVPIAVTLPRELTETRARVLQESAQLDDDPTRWFRAAFFDALHEQVSEGIRLPDGPTCETGFSKSWLTDAGSLHADAARLEAALELMAIDVAQLVDEEVVGFDQAMHGMDRALDASAAYLAARRWEPSQDAPTLAISIKGGASSGVYSAGVTWRVLTMVERYREYKSKKPLSPGIPAAAARFDLAAGTSAGAIIAATVDLFHQDACVLDKQATEIRKDPRLPQPVPPVGAWAPATGSVCQTYARSLLATLFTCVDQGSLYCVDSRPLWEVASKQKGLMEFDGLRELLQRYIGPLAPVNPMELVLTTVDFRWGELYVQSDQDPSSVLQPPPLFVGSDAMSQTLKDVHASIEASFVLPFIAWPVEKLRVEGEQDRPGVFLDGGIKSEIPILSLIERGAQRTLVVGSAPPKITPTKPQTSGLDIAARYLDVSLSAVTESEWNAAVPVAEHIEGFERAACLRMVDAEGLQPLDAEAYCSGDLAGACGGEKRDHGFDRMAIFRREDVDPSIGYTFDPTQMRRLFDAGAAAARANCRELAEFMGMNDVPAEELDSWCNETPRTEPELCKQTHEEYRTCDFEPESRRKSQR